MKRFISMSIILMSLYGGTVLAEGLCPVIANEDLKDMTIPELQRKMDGYDSLRKVRMECYESNKDGYKDLASRCIDDVVQCSTESLRIERVIRTLTKAEEAAKPKVTSKSKKHR